MDTGTDDVGSVGAAMRTLGGSLRQARLRSGMSLREMARQLGVSPSFVSQLENGKSQPSVATLYSMAHLLGVSIDELFQPEVPRGASNVEVPTESGTVADPVHRSLSRGDYLDSPADAWNDGLPMERIRIVKRSERPRLEMDSGVIWEQLASSGWGDLDFMEITYPGGSTSTTDGRMLRHQGREYGYLISGELEITYGFDVHRLRAGESMVLDPAVPHLLANPGSEVARGIWVVQHRQA